MSSRPGSGGGWRVRRSIAWELDVAADHMREDLAMLPRSLVDLAMTIPPTWMKEYEAFGPADSPDREQVNLFDYLSRWADVMEVEDYDTASAAMREITLDDAISQVAEASGLEPAVHLEPTERLIDLELRLSVKLLSQFGLYPASDEEVLERESDQALAAVQILRGEPLHDRFWHWVDRFYYEAYRPWRETRLDAIEALEQTAIAGLGSLDGTSPPDLGWLPPENALVAIPAVGAAAAAGECEVVFWAEPFGISTGVEVAPGILMTSFAEHGIDLEYSLAVLDGLTAKLKALADPTRVSILRFTRNSDADNTQIAGYLQVSRPTVSVHAKILSEAGLISTTREGRQARHAFHPDAVRQLCDDLLRYLDVAAENPDE